MPTVRTSTPLNDLNDAVLVRLGLISHRKNPVYLTTPATVKRLPAMGDFAQVKKPILALQTLGWEVEPQVAQRFDGILTLGVHCMSENVADPEGELLDLVSDVFYALCAVDVQLNGKAVYLFMKSFEPNADLSQRTGLAVTTVSFECRYRFDATAP